MNCSKKVMVLDLVSHSSLPPISVRQFFGNHSPQLPLELIREQNLKEPSLHSSTSCFQSQTSFTVCSRPSIDKTLPICSTWLLQWLSFSSLSTSKASGLSSNWAAKRWEASSNHTQSDSSTPQTFQLFCRQLSSQISTSSLRFLPENSEETLLLDFLENGKITTCLDTQHPSEVWHTTSVHHRAFMISKEILLTHWYTLYSFWAHALSSQEFGSTYQAQAQET